MHFPKENLVIASIILRSDQCVSCYSKIFQKLQNVFQVGFLVEGCGVRNLKVFEPRGSEKQAEQTGLAQGAYHLLG